MKYTAFCEFFGKKIKIQVEADSERDAKELVKESHYFS
jgi:hypothetical protein